MDTLDYEGSEKVTKVTNMQADKKSYEELSADLPPKYEAYLTQTQRASRNFRRRINVEISTSIFQRFSTFFRRKIKKPSKYRRRFDVESTSKKRWKT